MKKHFVAKISQGIWETFLYENNRNYISYKFSLQICILSISRNQKQESKFKQVVGSNEKCFRFLFIASRVILQRYAEFNRLLL